MKIRIYITVTFLLTFNGAILFAQQPSPPDSSLSIEKNNFENLRLQVENYLLVQPPQDSLAYLLLDDADGFAENGEWQAGYELLETIFELYNNEITEQPADSQNILAAYKISPQIHIRTTPVYPATPKSYLQAEMGIDYSQQEFELSFQENDSTILEELQNPYVGLLFNHFLRVSNQQVSFYHRLRLDNQFVYYNFQGTMESRFAKGRSRLDFQGYYYHQQAQIYSDFLDGQLRYSWSKLLNGRNSLYLNMRSRYKWFTSPDSLNTNLFSGGLNAYYEHYFGGNSSLSLNLIPEVYREEVVSGLKYFQNRFEALWRMRSSYNQYLELGAATVYRSFSDEFDGEEYNNSFWSTEARLRTEFSFWPVFGLDLRFTGEKRNYSRVDEIYPDYLYGLFEGILKYYFNSFQSVGAGYFREGQNNSTPAADIQLLVDQEDFTSQGLILYSEIFNYSGLMINLEYRLGWRNYPHAIPSPFSSYYSDRMVHSIAAFGWIPLTIHWQIQFFANYDNDQDRENENNDNRSTILNLGLIYRF